MPSTNPFALHTPALRPFAVAAGFSMCVNLLVLAGPMFSLQVFDRVLTSRSLETLAMLLALALVALAALSWLDSIRTQLLSHGAARLEASAFGRVLRATIESGPWAAKPYAYGLRDLRVLRQFLGSAAMVAFIDMPWCPIFVGVLYLFHPSFGLVAVAGVTALLLLAAAGDFLNRRAMDAAASASRAAGQCADDAIRNADAVRAMGMVDTVERRVITANEAATAQNLSASRRASRIVAISKLVRQSVQVVMLALAAYLVIHGETSPGAMIAATLLLSRAMAPIDSAIAGWRGMAEARSAYQRLAAWMPESAPANAMPLPAPAGALTVDGVTLAIGDGPAVLKQVAFNLSPGEFLGVVGASGAGKSMLGRLLVGVLAPTDGHVRLDGADLRAWRPDQLGPQVGYLPQDVQLFDGTVAANIARLGDPAEAHERIVEAARLAGIHEAVLAMPKGYDTPIGPSGQALSGGLRQQVGIARAFFGNPRLVVLDEPNSNLDARGEVALIAALEAVSQASATVVVITHRPALLRRADKVLALQRGSVLEYGERDSVLTKLARGNPQPVALATVRHTERHNEARSA